MKKIIAMLLAVIMVFALVACTKEPAKNDDPVTDIHAKGEGVMTHAEYMAAEKDAEVVVECFVQGSQSWWFDSDANHGKITLYAQDKDGGYFAYGMKCDEADAAKLVPGTKIKITGYKTEWEGEIEIVDATFEILEGSYVADILDATALLGTDELIKHQNEKVSFKDLTVVSITYQGGERGKDIYVTMSLNGAEYDFCVESYLTNADSDLYRAVEALQAGDVVDVEGFLYWYQGENTHITAITVK